MRASVCCRSVWILYVRSAFAAVAVLSPLPVDEVELVPAVVVDSPAQVADTYMGCWPLQVAPVRYNYTSYMEAGERKPMTYDVCSEFCKRLTKYYSLFGGDTCFCSPFLHSEVATANPITVGCNKGCAGNPDELCGGDNTLSVYEIGQCGVRRPKSNLEGSSCPWNEVTFDFSDYDSSCEPHQTSRLFRKVSSHLGLYQDLVVEPIAASGATTSSSALSSIKGVGFYIDFPVKLGTTFSFRLYLVSSGTETRQVFHNVSLSVYGIGLHESVNTVNVTNFKMGSNVVETKNNADVMFKSNVPVEPQTLNSAPVTDAQKSHSVTVEFVGKTEVQFQFTATGAGDTVAHFFLSGVSNSQNPFC